MLVLERSHVRLVSLASIAAMLATGCFGKAGPDAFVAGAILGTVFVNAANAHAERERQEAWEREHDDAPAYPRVIVVHDRDGVVSPAVPVQPPPAAPPPVPFDARAARSALADVDLTACRAAGAPRGYGHAVATVNPSGEISKVVVEEPVGMPPAAAQCIGAALGRVTVPEFTGSFIRIGTTFFVP